jgi:hypothetical protein
VAALVLAALVLAVFGGATQHALAYDLTKVKNRSFEKDSNGDGTPNGWFRDGLTPKDKRVCNQSYSGACSFKMVGNDSEKFLYQVTLYSSGPAGVEETLSVYTKGKSIVNAPGGFARVWLRFNQTDGGTEWHGVQLPPGNSGWTYREVSGTAIESFSSIEVWLDMRAASGKMWVDLVDVNWTGGP